MTAVAQSNQGVFAMEVRRAQNECEYGLLRSQRFIQLRILRTVRKERTKRVGVLGNRINQTDYPQNTMFFELLKRLAIQTLSNCAATDNGRFQNHRATSEKRSKYEGPSESRRLDNFARTVSSDGVIS